MIARPLISCILPTYKRLGSATAVVEEAVASFLWQEYSPKELIIVNDCPEQRVYFDHPEVIVANRAERFTTLGEKLNYAISLSQGDYICRFDDDDISLPWRLSYTLDKLLSAGKDTWQSVEFWFLFNNGIQLSTRADLPAPSKAIFSRKALEGVGLFTAMNAGQDLELERKLRRNGVAVDRNRIPPEEVYYIYRWTAESYHTSGYKPEVGYGRIGNIAAKPGDYWLEPHFRKDYLDIVRKLAKEAHDAGTENNS